MTFLHSNWSTFQSVRSLLDIFRCSKRNWNRLTRKYQRPSGIKLCTKNGSLHARNSFLFLPMQNTWHKTYFCFNLSKALLLERLIRLSSQNRVRIARVFDKKLRFFNFFSLFQLISDTSQVSVLLDLAPKPNCESVLQDQTFENWY